MNNSLISQLQSRIDKRGNAIAAYETLAYDVKNAGRNVRDGGPLAEALPTAAKELAEVYFVEAAAIRRQCVKPLVEAQKMDVRILRALREAVVLIQYASDVGAYRDY